MADDNRSSREIEREIEQERAELRGSIDQLLGRLTFQDAWERTGAYLRDNRSEYGHTLGRMIKEKPFALALTAVGISWLLFGPATPASGSRGDTRVRRLSDADRDRPSAPPLPPSRAETAAGAPRWPPEHRPSSGAGTQAASRNSSGAGSGVDVASPTPSRSTPDAVGPAKTPGSTSAGDLTTGSPSRGNPGGATSRSTVSTSAAGNQNQTAKDRPLGTPSAASTSSEEDSRGDVRSPSASISTSAKSTPEPKSHSGSETFDQDKGKTPKSLP